MTRILLIGLASAGLVTPGFAQTAIPGVTNPQGGTSTQPAPTGTGTVTGGATVQPNPMGVTGTVTGGATVQPGVAGVTGGVVGSTTQPGTTGGTVTGTGTATIPGVGGATTTGGGMIQVPGVLGQPGVVGQPGIYGQPYTTTYPYGYNPYQQMGVTTNGYHSGMPNGHWYQGGGVQTGGNAGSGGPITGVVTGNCGLGTTAVYSSYPTTYSGYSDWSYPTYSGGRSRGLFRR